MTGQRCFRGILWFTLMGSLAACGVNVKERATAGEGNTPPHLVRSSRHTFVSGPSSTGVSSTSIGSATTSIGSSSATTSIGSSTTGTISNDTATTSIGSTSTSSSGVTNTSSTGVTSTSSTGVTSSSNTGVTSTSSTGVTSTSSTGVTSTTGISSTGVTTTTGVTGCGFINLDVTIFGHVADLQTGTPLAGAFVTNQTVSTFTDGNGNYSMTQVVSVDDCAGSNYFATVCASDGSHTSSCENVSAFMQFSSVSLGANLSLASDIALQNFVIGLYRDVLGRTAAQSEIAGWVNYLASHSRTDAASAFLHSQEYRTDLISSYYQKYLRRNPDAGGLAYWVGQLNIGMSDENVQVGFLSSGEYFAIHGSTNSQFVAGLYNDVLGRNAAPSEINGWLSYMAASHSRADVANLFVDSFEYRTDLVTSWYGKYLGRSPDSGGLNAWVGALNSVSNETVQAGFLGSAEYYGLQQ